MFPKVLLKEKPYLIRLILFNLAYLAINSYYSIITNALYSYKFTVQDPIIIYLLPALTVILFLARKKEMLSFNNDKKTLKYSILLILLSLGIFLIPTIDLLLSSPTNGNIGSHSNIIIIYYAQLILGNALLFIGMMGRNFTKKFKKEILFIAFTVILYIATQFLVENNWRYLSQIITSILGYILPLISQFTYINTETLNIRMHDFSVYIGPPCAGIYSMSTFFFLYLVMVIMKSKSCKIDPTKGFLALVAGLITIFILNIIRILIIILVGAYVSKTLAIQLFHEYLSSIFLIMIIILYLYKIIPKILIKE